MYTQHSAIEPDQQQHNMVTMMWPRISSHHSLKASLGRGATGSLASLNLSKHRTYNLCQPHQNQFTFNSWRSFVSSDSSFHGISLPEDEDDRQALQSSNNPMIQEAEVVKSDEDKQKIRESIAEVVRAELSAYSTPKQGNTQINDDEDKHVLEGYERLLQMLNNAQARHDHMKADNSLEYTQSMMDLGELHYQLGNMDQSQDIFMSALKQLLESNTGIERKSMLMVAQCMHSLGAVHARCGEFDEAFRWYEEAVRRKNEIIKESSNSESINSYHFELGKTYNALAALQTMRGGLQWRDAMSMFQLAERHQLHGFLRSDDDTVLEMEGNFVTKNILEKLTPHHVQSIVNIRFNVGKLLQQHGQYDDAVGTFRDALDLARLDVERMTIDDVQDFGESSAVSHPSPFERKNSVVELLVQIADCHASAQNYDEAAQAYEEALGYHIFFRRWKGNSVESKRQEASVLPATFSATHIKLDCDNATTMEAAIRSNLAHALAHIGQEKLGLEHYESSLKIKRQIGGNNHIEVAHTLMGMGAVYGGPLRDFATALNCFKEALYIYRGKMNELTDECGLSGSNKFFEDDETVEIDGHIQNAVKNIGLIEAGLLRDREDGITKKRR